MSSMPNEAKQNKNWEKLVKKALDDSNLESVKKLISQENYNNKIRLGDSRNINILDYAIRNSLLNVVKYLCETYPDLLLQVAKEEYCSSGPIRVVMDKVVRYKESESMLNKFKYLARQLQRTEQIKDKEEYLISAINCHAPILVKCIIDEWYSAYLYGNDASKALKAAVSLGTGWMSNFPEESSKALVELLISKGADVEKVKGILDLAIKKGNEHLGEILVKNGANPALLSEESKNKLKSPDQIEEDSEEEINQQTIDFFKQRADDYLNKWKSLYKTYRSEKVKEEKTEPGSELSFYYSSPVTFNDNYILGNPAPIKFLSTGGRDKDNLPSSEIEMNEIKPIKPLISPNINNLIEGEKTILENDSVPANSNKSRWPEFFSPRENSHLNGEIEMNRITPLQDDAPGKTILGNNKE